MTIKLMLTLATVLIIISVIIIVRKLAFTGSVKKTKIIFSATAITSLVVIAILIFLEASLMTRGATLKEANNTYISDGILQLKHAPSEYEGDVEPGDILVLRKYGCQDCLDIYDDLEKYAEKHDLKIKYVSTTSKIGRDIIKNNNIEDVPSIIYVLQKDNGKNNIMHAVIFKSTKDGKAKLNTEILEIFVSAKKEKR
ncbi:hypothetical protein [Mogibacterium diversum]|uniref:hypothetical protein n=1 Tax=Mogibacterium diversum TaxID=114527 RepID=UPI0028D6BD67|nr:hypothetical protein [Mogibacterium diversum]